MRHRARPYRLAFLLLLAASAARGASSGPVWIATPEEGLASGDAWSAGVEVLDRLPGVFVLDEEHSARALARIGYDIAGPIALPGGGEVSLALINEAGVAAGTTFEAVDRYERVRVLWTDGRRGLVHSDRVLTEAAPLLGLDAKRLRSSPLCRPIPGGDARAAKGATTTFAPIIDQMVARVDSATYMQWIGNLAGNNEVVISGFADTIHSRYTAHADCDTAERYVYERFLDMGFADVQFDPYSFNDIDARNVVATLPGTETPERIYIVCGHMDATSLNPSLDAHGANDNGSGTSVVLTTAGILKDHTFRSTIKFIAFTGEEQGLRGSSHYAEAAAAAGDSILGVVNCDMVAFYETNYGIDIEGGWAWDWLMQILSDATAQYTGLSTNLSYSSWGSDHVSFQNYGFPAILAIEHDWNLYHCYHRPCDLTDQNDGNFGADVTRACLATIAHLAEPIVETGVAAAGAPARLVLHGARPNPFNPSTTIAFSLPRRGEADLSLFDLAGRRVRTLHRGALEAGPHRAFWDGKDAGGAAAPSGVYFVRLESDGKLRTKKMTLIR